jgi:hypothetical protein
MFFVEACVCFLFIGGYFTWLLVSDRVQEWRDKKEAERVSSAVNELRAQKISSILQQLGPPREHFEGSSGRSLYVWRSPPSTGLPRTRGVLTVTLTVDANGEVVESAWNRR